GNLERAFKATIKAAGVPVIRFHDMRRTAATLWALQGASPKAIQKLLGHSTPYLAMAIYTDVVDGQLQSAVIDPASVLSGGTNGVGRFTETGTESGEGDDAGTAVDGGADAK